MAFRAINELRLMLAPAGGNRAFATSAAPKMKHFAENVRDSEAAQSTMSSIWKFLRKPENAPVAVLLGFLIVPLTIGTHSALQQLMHAPMVVINKNKRAMYEVDNPDAAVNSSDKFINKSFLRKVGHIQEPGSPSMPDSVQHDPFTRPRTAATLKTVGVDPSRR